MSKQYQITGTDYIHFLITATCDVSCVKAADCHSKTGIVVSHDKFNRFLTRQSLTTETLWMEVAPCIERRNGWLVLDDTVIDKIHSEKIETTHFQWSGKHRKVVKGIGLVTLCIRSSKTDPLLDEPSGSKLNERKQRLSGPME